MSNLRKKEAHGSVRTLLPTFTCSYRGGGPCEHTTFLSWCVPMLMMINTTDRAAEYFPQRCLGVPYLWKQCLGTPAKTPFSFRGVMVKGHNGLMQLQSCFPNRVPRGILHSREINPDDVLADLKTFLTVRLGRHVLEERLSLMENRLSQGTRDGKITFASSLTRSTSGSIFG